ncbi:MAG TPA: RNA-binding protein [Candidatus Tectomicrobia bacterium]|nr:RNA-binding protein [Candidatus Tectomicrobia bacterium]
MAQKLFIGGLSWGTSSEELREHFQQAGTVTSATVVMDETGRSRGFGFVEMASSEEAEKAVAQLNGQSLGGRTLKVEVAKPRAGGSSRGASRGGYRTSRW